MIADFIPSQLLWILRTLSFLKVSTFRETDISRIYRQARITKSFENLYPSPILLISESNLSISSRALSQWDTIVENSKSLFDKTVPPEFTRTKMSRTLSIESVSTSK